MKRSFLLLAFATLLAGAAYSADDPLRQGMQLYKKHRFEEAFNTVYSYLPVAGSNLQDNIRLSLGTICLENAKLYRELYRISLTAHLDYLTRLVSDKGPSASRLARLYLGHMLLQVGDLTQAVGFFNKFIADQRIGERHRQIAKVGLGTAYYLEGKRSQANRYWSKVNTSDPQVMASLAAAYSKAGLADKQPAVMCARAIAIQSKSRKTPLIQVVSDTIGVYAAAERIEESYQLLKHADVGAFFYEETLVKNKAIRFYNPALLQNLALLYGKAGLKFLEKASASADKQIQAAALYYLSECYELFGSPAQSKQKVQALISAGGMPAQIENRLKARLAIIDYLIGNEKEAEEQLSNLLKIKTDPDFSADILLAGCNHQILFAPAVTMASAIAQAGEGKTFANINFAIGKYHLFKKEYNKAISFMEAGRDKSNKNKVESNNLLMLVNLAEAYYRSKKFSEALEIFFEMSKHYPAVRQIQVAIQGIYSMEQQSAGDATIF